ncbi:MAG: endopeptidase La [Proteobacteria bacterium]|nr:endopeptidase La [Pseudomonadota bacterium]
MPISRSNTDPPSGRPSTPSVEYPVLATRSPVVLPDLSESTLQVGRAASVRAVETAERSSSQIFVVPQKNPDVLAPAPSDLHLVGVLADILRVDKSGPRSYAVTLRARERCAVIDYETAAPMFVARVESVPSVPGHGIANAMAAVKEPLGEILGDKWDDSERVKAEVEDERDPEALIALIASQIELDREVKIAVLTGANAAERLRAILPTLKRLRQVLSVKASIDAQLSGDATRDARERVLRDRMRAIQEELGESEGELDEYRGRIDGSDMPKEVREAALRQLGRMSHMAQSSPEYNVARTYLETLLDIPWGITTEDRLDVAVAREILDADHSGLDKVKKRILEFIAVRKLAPDKQGPILCLVGPPGVGKTSLGRSIASALERKYVRVSLGGMRDESEIRGHRRTYIGALPGRIASGLTKAGSMNPVFVLDEIDKLGSDMRGDPASAMLEVLDPEQNHAFSDHYLEVDIDLSRVMFLATANQAETIPPALFDRMEVINLPGYTHDEKRVIARDHLIPKQIKDHGLDPEQLDLGDEPLDELISRYTREAGVRNLEREVAALCRHAAVEIAGGKSGGIAVTAETLAEIMGPPRFHSEIADRHPEVGICTGLSWTPTGGDIMFIEARSMPGRGELKLTGQLGDIMNESATAAFSWVRANAQKLDIDLDNLESLDIHMHIPSGAIKKDGPSAGVAISTALVSLLRGKPVRNDVAITGEITLRGLSLPVGGIKEKILAAHRAGIKTVLLPERNRKDMEDIPTEIRDSIEICFVKRVDEALAIAIDDLSGMHEHIPPPVPGQPPAPTAQL